MATDDIIGLKLDDEGDVVVEEDQYGNQSFALVRSIDAIRQNIQVRVLTMLGERVLHPDYGIDFPAIEKPFDQNLVRGEVVRTILQDPDVQEILDIGVEFDGRTRHAIFTGTIRLKDDELIGIAGVT